MMYAGNGGIPQRQLFDFSSTVLQYELPSIFALNLQHDGSGTDYLSKSLAVCLHNMELFWACSNSYGNSYDEANSGAISSPIENGQNADICSTCASSVL